MDIVFITLGVFLVCFAGMAVGVIVSDLRIKGSCGGLGNLFGESACDICNEKDRCKESDTEICEDGTV
jgi:hypothetical protein